MKSIDGSWDAFGVPHNLVGLETTPLHPNIINRTFEILPERVPFIKRTALSALQPHIVLRVDAEVRVSFVREGASLHNALCFYTFATQESARCVVPPNRNNIELTVLFPNCSGMRSGGHLLPGDTVSLGKFPCGTAIGFALLPNAWDETARALRENAEATALFIAPELNASGLANGMLLFDDDTQNTLICFEDIDVSQTHHDESDHDFNDAIFVVRTDPPDARRRLELSVPRPLHETKPFQLHATREGIQLVGSKALPEKIVLNMPNDKIAQHAAENMVWRGATSVTVEKETLRLEIDIASIQREHQERACLGSLGENDTTPHFQNFLLMESVLVRNVLHQTLTMSPANVDASTMQHFGSSIVAWERLGSKTLRLQSVSLADPIVLIEDSVLQLTIKVRLDTSYLLATHADETVRNMLHVVELFVSVENSLVVMDTLSLQLKEDSTNKPMVVVHPVTRHTDDDDEHLCEPMFHRDIVISFPDLPEAVVVRAKLSPGKTTDLTNISIHGYHTVQNANKHRALVSSNLNRVEAGGRSPIAALDMEALRTQLRPPRHQTHRVKRTLASHADVAQIHGALSAHAIQVGFVNPKNPAAPRGRLFDGSVIVAHLQKLDGVFLRFAEFGARDSVLGCFVAGVERVQSVHVSDHFKGWGEGTDDWLGGEDEWFEKWRSMVPNSFPEEHFTVANEDILYLPHADNTFDAVACVSVLEHMYNQGPEGKNGDIAALRELARVVRPGGLVFLTAVVWNGDGDIEEGCERVGTSSVWHSGTLYLSERDLWKRWIESTELFDGLSTVSASDASFSLTHPDCDALFNVKTLATDAVASPAVFALCVR